MNSTSNTTSFKNIYKSHLIIVGLECMHKQGDIRYKQAMNGLLTQNAESTLRLSRLITWLKKKSRNINSKNLGSRNLPKYWSLPPSVIGLLPTIMWKDLHSTQITQWNNQCLDWPKLHTWTQLLFGTSHCTQVRSLPLYTSIKYCCGGFPIFIVT